MPLLDLKLSTESRLPRPSHRFTTSKVTVSKVRLSPRRPRNRHFRVRMLSRMLWRRAPTNFRKWSQQILMVGIVIRGLAWYFSVTSTNRTSKTLHSHEQKQSRKCRTVQWSRWGVRACMTSGLKTTRPLTPGQRNSLSSSLPLFLRTWGRSRIILQTTHWRNWTITTTPLGTLPELSSRSLKLASSVEEAT